MLLVKNGTSEEVEVKSVKQLLSMIPEEALGSLKRQINDESAFGDYLEQFIAQNRRVALDDLAKVTSTAVRVLHLKSKDIEMPGHPGGYIDWAMFHYLYPDAQATGGKNSEIWKLAKDAIGRAQHEWRFNGSAVLDLYATYAQFFLDQGIDAGNAEKLAELRDEARKGSVVGEARVASSLEQELAGLPAGKPFIMPLSYGGHQTYIRVSYVKPSYRLEYFDRQRQALTLGGKEITGYLQDTGMTQARPVCFDFEIEPKALVSICEKAQTIAMDDVKPNELPGNTPRRKILEMFAEAAKGIAVVGDPESAQHPDAINCAWASLESAIRLRLGPESLQKQVEFMREVAVTRYIAQYGEPAEKAVAGLLLL